MGRNTADLAAPIGIHLRNAEKRKNAANSRVFSLLR
jgi:hypothetical protein